MYVGEVSIVYWRGGCGENFISFKCYKIKSLFDMFS